MFGQVGGDACQFEVGAVDHCALTAAAFRTHQVLEAVSAQTAAVVLRTCGGQQRERQRERQDGSNYLILYLIF